jgi:hypothetical protein
MQERIVKNTYPLWQKIANATSSIILAMLPSLKYAASYKEAGIEEQTLVLALQEVFSQKCYSSVEVFARQIRLNDEILPNWLEKMGCTDCNCLAFRFQIASGEFGIVCAGAANKPKFHKPQLTKVTLPVLAPDLNLMLQVFLVQVVA